MAFDTSPSEKELQDFNAFINKLDSFAADIDGGKTPGKDKIKQGFLGTIIPPFPRTKAKKDFGIQQVNEELCNACGTCKKKCTYEAIELSPKPVFNHEKCFGCWSCYNHCAQKAIFTKKFDGDFQYPKPIKELVEKLS